MRYPIRTSGSGSRRGIAMIAVLVVVAILALAAYRFSDLMVAEQRAADSYTRAQQARASAISGIYYAAAQLAQNSQADQGGAPNYYYNPPLFQDVLVQDGDTDRDRAFFSIVSPVGPDAAAAGGVNQSFLYGVTDETGKLNINALFKLDSSGTILYNVLMQLPNMTDPIANSIVFWVDPKATARPSGATDEYYQTLDPPYHAKNAPLDQLEELLFVQGVTPQLLFGNDRNRNGILDPDEDDGTGALDMGWSAYLTVYSRESNVDSGGNPRIYVNDPDLTSLQTYLDNAGFDQNVSTFILAARTYGLTSPNNGGGSGGNGGSGNGSGTNGSTPSGQSNAVSMNASNNNGAMTISLGAATNTAASSGAVAAKAPLTRSALGNAQQSGGSGGGGGGQTISSLYSLINATVTIPGQNGQAGTTYTSPLSDSGSIKQFLPMILDKLTTKKSAFLPARVNVNTAPSAVLSALAPNGTPLLDVSTVQTIMGARPQYTTGETPDPIFLTPTWLITEASLPVSLVQSLDQYITAHSQVYRVQSVGHFDSGGPTARVEAVIDTNAGRPRIIYFRDLTGLGKGFNMQAPQQ